MLILSIIIFLLLRLHTWCPPMCIRRWYIFFFWNLLLVRYLFLSSACETMMGSIAAFDWVVAEMLDVLEDLFFVLGVGVDEGLLLNVEPLVFGRHLKGWWFYFSRINLELLFKGILLANNQFIFKFLQIIRACLFYRLFSYSYLRLRTLCLILHYLLCLA